MYKRQADSTDPDYIINIVNLLNLGNKPKVLDKSYSLSELLAAERKSVENLTSCSGCRSKWCYDHDISEDSTEAKGELIPSTINVVKLFTKCSERYLLFRINRQYQEYNVITGQPGKIIYHNNPIEIDLSITIQCQDQSNNVIYYLSSFIIHPPGHFIEFTRQSFTKDEKNVKFQEYNDSIVRDSFNSHELLYNKENIYYAIYVNDLEEIAINLNSNIIRAKATETRTTSSKSIKRTTARTKRTKPTTVSQCVSNLVKEHDFEVKIIDLVLSLIHISEPTRRS